MTLRAIFAAIMLCCNFAAIQARAADASPPPDIAHSLAIVVAEDTSTPVPRYSYSTGFFIDTQGTLVTSYHVKSKLGPVDPSKFHIRIYADEASATALVADEIWSSEATDVLVLRVTIGLTKFPALPQGDWRRVKIAQTVLHTAGYPKGLSMIQDLGYVTSFRGPTNSPDLLWTSNFRFDDGQSGSPVVDEAGRVVGIVRGVDEGAPFIGFIVPVSAIPDKYWESVARNGPVPAASATNPTLILTGTIPATDAKRRTVSFSVENPICAPPSQYGKVITADEGWQIVTASTRLTTLKAVGPNVVASPPVSDTSQISVNVALANIGNCFKLNSRIIVSDTPGSWEGRVDFIEVPLAGTRKSITVASTVLAAGRPVAVATINVEDLKASVVQPDGTTIDIPTSARTVSSVKGVLRINPDGIRRAIR